MWQQALFWEHCFWAARNKEKSVEAVKKRKNNKKQRNGKEAGTKTAEKGRGRKETVKKQEKKKNNKQQKV